VIQIFLIKNGILALKVKQLPASSFEISSAHLYLIATLYPVAGEIMSDTVEVSRDAFEPIALLVKEGLFKNEKDALKSLVLDQASSKIRHFDTKIREMQAKYKVSFEEFKEHIESRKKSESFEEWDDFIIWESYESARRYWADVEARLKGQNA
jgi:hypothetical protein